MGVFSQEEYVEQTAAACLSYHQAYERSFTVWRQSEQKG